MKLKQCCDFHLNMLRLSLHATGKASHKMSKFIREMCVEVREKFRKSQGTFFQICCGNPVQSQYSCSVSSWFVSSVHLTNTWNIALYSWKRKYIEWRQFGGCMCKTRPLLHIWMHILAWSISMGWFLPQTRLRDQ